VGADGAWQAINFTRDGSSEERRGDASSSWLMIKSWASIQRCWRSVDGGGLGNACMKASGDGAGTKAGLGVEELRADKTQEPATQRRLRKTHLTLPVLTQYLCVQAGERKVRGVLVRGRDALHNWNAIARITQ